MSSPSTPARRSSINSSRGSSRSRRPSLPGKYRGTPARSSSFSLVGRRSSSSFSLVDMLTFGSSQSSSVPAVQGKLLGTGEWAEPSDGSFAPKESLPQEEEVKDFTRRKRSSIRRKRISRSKSSL